MYDYVKSDLFMCRLNNKTNLIRKNENDMKLLKKSSLLKEITENMQIF